MKFSDALSHFAETMYGKQSINIDEAYQDGLFNNIKSFINKEYNTGRVLFFSEDPTEIYHYLTKEYDVVKVHVAFRAFCLRSGEWMMSRNGVDGFDIKLKLMKKKKRKNKQIPNSQRELIDKQHLNIKGQNNYSKWG